MRSRLCSILVLLCLLLLEGCAAKNTAPPAPVGRFPDQPVLALAKKPDQGLPEAAGRQAFSIDGGWGFRQADAFILTVPPGRRQSSYNNTVPLESLLVRTRNEVEFSGTPPQGKRYAVVDYGTVSRTLGVRQGRMYAVWRGQVRLLSEQESPALYQEAAARPLSRRATPAVMQLSRSVAREYWFDISDTFGGSALVAKKAASPGQWGALPATGRQ